MPGPALSFSPFCRSGSYLWSLLLVTPTHPPDDRRCTARNAAAIRLAEEAYRYLQIDSPPTQLAALIQSFDGSFVVKDAEGRVVLASPAFNKQFPGETEPTGRTETEVVPEEIRALISRADDLVLKQGRTVSFGFELAGDPLRKFVTQRLPLTTTTQGIVGLVGVVRELKTSLPEAGSDWPDGVTNLNQLEALDKREVELAQRLSHGATNKQLANHFGVSIRSIENWRRGLLNKLRLETIPELTRWVVRFEDFGLLPLG